MPGGSRARSQWRRYYTSTILQIISPLFFLLLLYILQEGAKASEQVVNAHPLSYPLGGLAPCTVRRARLDFQC